MHHSCRPLPTQQTILMDRRADKAEVRLLHDNHVRIGVHAWSRTSGSTCPLVHCKHDLLRPIVSALLMNHAAS